MAPTNNTVWQSCSKAVIVWIKFYSDETGNEFVCVFLRKYIFTVLSGNQNK